MTEESSQIFGIDLGTTYSCIAHIEHDRPIIIDNFEGNPITPSVVFFDGENRIVGEEAKNRSIAYKSQVPQEPAKRNMGNKDWAFTYEGVDYTAEEISSYILRKVVGDAEKKLNHTIKDVVITCPAYFGLNEREATVKAGEIAGLNVRSIINEPTAAAFAYGLIEEEDQVVLVYDLGGGTFDITMIEIKKDRVNVIATGGDHYLGGLNWDEVISNYLANEWKKSTGLDEEPLDDLESMQEIFIQAEKAKVSLSSLEKTGLAVTHAGHRVRVELTREKFNELTAHLLDRTIHYTYNMLEEAKKKKYTSFDKILLVGGSTRMPQVIERLRQEFNMEPHQLDPDKTVAMGAALYGQKLAIDEAIREYFEHLGDMSKAKEKTAEDFGLTYESVERIHERKATDVASHSFGVVVIDENDQDVLSNIIIKNTALPAKSTKTFGAHEADQPSVLIQIRENTSSDEVVALEYCEEIGRAELPLPPRQPRGTPIEVTFELNEQGRLHVIGRELQENRSIEATIVTTRVISGEQLEEAISRSSKLTVS
jgi:molecular chaperone DnaK